MLLCKLNKDYFSGYCYHCQISREDTFYGYTCNLRAIVRHFKHRRLPIITNGQNLSEFSWSVY